MKPTPPGKNLISHGAVWSRRFVQKRRRSTTFVEGATLPIRIQCCDASGGGLNPDEQIRFAMVVTLQVDETVQYNMYEEIRDSLLIRIPTVHPTRHSGKVEPYLLSTRLKGLRRYLEPLQHPQLSVMSYVGPRNIHNNLIWNMIGFAPMGLHHRTTANGSDHCAIRTGHGIVSSNILTKMLYSPSRQIII